jgi:hypothetical protein
MNSPYFIDEREALDRINSYLQEAEVRRLHAEAQRGTSGSWLASLSSQVQAAAKRVADTIGSSAVKPSEPAEQCC